MSSPRLRKYQAPDFPSIAPIAQKTYEKWLHGRAVAHAKRDKKRGNKTASTEAYKIAIHCAVLHCAGRDHYTGEDLNWSLLSRYSNAESRALGRTYKAKFALLPSVDHVGNGRGEADFKICAWRTNDAKNDLPYEKFVALCRSVVLHSDRTTGKGLNVSPES